MQLARMFVIAAALLAGCAGKPVCEVEFRAKPDPSVDAAKLEATCTALRQRFASAERVALCGVFRAGDSSIVVKLAREPDAETIEWLKQFVTRGGRLQFLAVADSGTPQFDAAEEQRRFDAWRSAHPAAPVAQFNQLARDAGGPLPSTIWLPGRSGTLDASLACERAADAASVFTGADLGKAYPSTDESGMSALGFRMLDTRRADFEAFTKRCLHRRLAIVYDGEVLTAPTVASPLAGDAIIASHFTEAERDDMVAVLRAGELPLALEFVELRKLP